MLPYLELPQLSLPLGQKIDIFGVLSTIGVGVGAPHADSCEVTRPVNTARRRVRRYTRKHCLLPRGPATTTKIAGSHPRPRRLPR